jgi:hypothetical protein
MAPANSTPAIEGGLTAFENLFVVAAFYERCSLLLSVHKAGLNTPASHLGVFGFAVLYLAFPS